jgi:hypothetical protein
MGSPSNGNSAISILRVALDGVFTDRRFFVRQSMSACEVAEYILTLIQQGECDPDILKLLAFKKVLVAQPVPLTSSDPFPTAIFPTGRCGEQHRTTFCLLLGMDLRAAKKARRTRDSLSRRVSLLTKIIRRR